MANPNTTEEPKQPLQKPGEYVPTPYAPPTPTASYEPMYNELQRQINEWAAKTDPQAQAEQDRKIQRGRAFWTGANLFANVIANAINAHGTAKGAPNMTFNDAASQKMYDTWRDADKELKADRRAAQQRLDALRLQDSQLRVQDAQARDKALLDAYNRNYEAGERANSANWQRGVREYETQEKQNREDEVYQRGLQDQRQNATTAFNRQVYMENLRNQHNAEQNSRRNGFDPDNKRVLVGNGYFKADNQREAENHIWNVFNMVRRAHNADDGSGQPRVYVQGIDNGYMPDTNDINVAYAYVSKAFRDLYTEGSQFKADYDRYASEYGASAASHPQAGGGSQGGGSQRITGNVR